MWQERKDFFEILKMLTWDRCWNLFLLWFSYFFSIVFKIPKVWSAPFSVSIEPTTKCNLYCAECITGTRRLTRPQGAINPDFFRKIIDEIYKKTFYLNLYLQGEPFLHPHLLEMATFAVKKKMFVCISTNGHFLDDEICLSIVKSGIQKIIISVDGASEENYKKYRRGGDFMKVKKGIKTLSTAKKKFNSKYPELVMQMLVNKYNEREIPIVKQLMVEMGADRLELKSMQIYNDYSFLPASPKYRRYIKDKQGKISIKNKLHNRCFRLWSNEVVTWDQKLIPCCYDKNAEHEIENIQQFPFIELWKSNEFQIFRSSVLKNRKSIEICRNCTV
ncbi:MAG: radical SAM protein [Bacteroidetes bacterium CG23_combo_of_CG06-09_8_20_14_all_32_9]|nr:MAG: radical SAM protein [Bacteroidetes bacterium CG23_combo_of_CG06-09_8_20_14_all_32_9]